MVAAQKYCQMPPRPRGQCGVRVPTVPVTATAWRWHSFVATSLASATRRMRAAGRSSHSRAALGGRSSIALKKGLRSPDQPEPGPGNSMFPAWVLHVQTSLAMVDMSERDCAESKDRLCRYSNATRYL